MTRIASILILLTSLAVTSEAAELFDPPEGLETELIENPNQELIKEIYRYSDSDNLINISLIEYPPLTSEQGRVDMTAGMLSGMTNKGFIQESTSETYHNQIPVTKVTGEFPLGDEYGKYANESYLLFTTESTYALSLNWHDSIEKPSFSEKILDRLNLKGTAPTLPQQSESSPTSVSYKIGEMIGYYGVLALFGVFIFRAIRKRL